MTSPFKGFTDFFFIFFNQLVKSKKIWSKFSSAVLHRETALINIVGLYAFTLLLMSLMT